MKKMMANVVLTCVFLVPAMSVQARDTKLLLPISTAMELNDAQEKLSDSVKFFFGSQKTPKVKKKLGSDSTSRKTNAFGKSDEKACNWAFLSAMVALEKRAHALGANAVVNIVSNYKQEEMSSSTEFECHAGGIMAGVALKADFVKIAD